MDKMRLTHTDIDTVIELSSEYINILVVENPSQFYKFTFSLLQQSNGDDGQFILSTAKGEKKISESIDFISDVNALNLNSKKIINGLTKKITENCKQYFSEFAEIYAKCLIFADTVTEKLNLNIEYSCEPSVNAFMKFCGINLSDRCDNLLDKLINYVNALTELTSIGILAFVNLKSFLSTDELIQFYRHCQYKQIALLLFENSTRQPIENEKIIIIDKDLCEILVNYSLMY